MFTLSSEDVTLGTQFGSYYPYITDNCYGSSNTYATNAANLSDPNIPACYTVLSIT
ncbi:MAG: hypothetical protein VZR53_00395 [Prevotella sp.]|nr:hypothetical protein [Prevotella sp.]